MPAPSFFEAALQKSVNSVNKAPIDYPRAAENEIIGLFVELVQSFGAPKSLGALYGLLFASEKPLAFDQIVDRLKMSTGSVSQGLKLLKAIGAIRTIFIPGERRDFYVAETQIRKLAAGFLRSRVAPQLATTEARLNAFAKDKSEDQGHLSPFLIERIALLERWQFHWTSMAAQIIASFEDLESTTTSTLSIPSHSTLQ